MTQGAESEKMVAQPTCCAIIRICGLTICIIMALSRKGEARCIETGLQDGNTLGIKTWVKTCCCGAFLDFGSRHLFPLHVGSSRGLMIILIMLRVDSHYNEMQRYFTSHPPHLVHCGDHFCPGHCHCHAHHRALSMLKVVQLVRKWPNGQEWPKVAEKNRSVEKKRKVLALPQSCWIRNSTGFYSLSPQNIHLNI